MLDESSGATVSIVVHKSGPASGWLGHNLLLRARRFLLRPNLLSPNVEKSSSAHGSDIHFAFQSNDPSSSPISSTSSSSKNELLLKCCDAVHSASFDPLSIAVAGSISEKFVPSSSSSPSTSALFKWSRISPMSDFDSSQILKQVHGKGGILSKRDLPDVIPEIKFEKSLSAEHVSKIDNSTSDQPRTTITGNLSIAGNTNQVTCSAFLSSNNSISNMDDSSLNVVFQCPVDSKKWEIPVASFLGLLTTEPEVIVEVAVPVNKLLQ